jgi:hypothetical protein
MPQVTTRQAMPPGSVTSPRSRLLGRLSTALLGLALVLCPATASAARAPMVSVQPLDGHNGARVRREVARVVRSRRYRVVTEIPKASGTGQYYTWAREAGITAFVVGELVKMGQRQRATFLVWSGHDGSVVGRWTVTAHASRLPGEVARGFWRRLGPALRRARPPAKSRAPRMSPGPTIRIDASSDGDEPISGIDITRRRSL